MWTHENICWTAQVFLREGRCCCQSLQRDSCGKSSWCLRPVMNHSYKDISNINRHCCHFPPQMDYRSLVREKDEAIYAEIRVIVLDIRGFYVSEPTGIRNLTKPSQTRMFMQIFCSNLFTLGWTLWYHQQESWKSDQSQRRGEAVNVLKLERTLICRRHKDRFTHLRSSWQISFLSGSLNIIQPFFSIKVMLNTHVNQPWIKFCLSVLLVQIK